MYTKLRVKDIATVLREYGKLHDGLSEMIEEGRLRESDIPDDYQWLVRTLTKLAGYWNVAEAREVKK